MARLSRIGCLRPEFVLKNLTRYDERNYSQQLGLLSGADKTSSAPIEVALEVVNLAEFTGRSRRGSNQQRRASDHSLTQQPSRPQARSRTVDIVAGGLLSMDPPGPQTDHWSRLKPGDGSSAENGTP
jgi:hypothetical protein